MPGDSTSSDHYADYAMVLINLDTRWAATPGIIERARRMSATPGLVKECEASLGA